MKNWWAFKKNLFVKSFIWTRTTKFSWACRNHACKSTQDLFHSKFENDSNATFSKKKTIFPSFLLSKNEKKSASGHAKCSCGNRAKKFLVKLLKTFAGLSVNDQKMISFLKNLFVKKFVWTCTMKFWRASRNIVGKKTKNTPNLQKRWIYNFLSKYVFFHQKLFFSTGECIFENALKVFSPKIYRFAVQSPETTKKTEFFERKIYFLKMFLIHVECSCDNPAKCF